MKEYYRRNLPHYQPPFGTYFVTTRLDGSLPREAIMRLIEERERNLKAIRSINEIATQKKKAYNIYRKYFAQFDELLEGQIFGQHWLADDRIASLVMEALLHRDRKVYNLYCATIMPNHIHMVFNLERNDIPLYKVLQSFKRHTALEANRILGRSGSFWQSESYDHVVRDGAELERIIMYVFLNPEKARLVKKAREWKWNYIRDDFQYLIDQL